MPVRYRPEYARIVGPDGKVLGPVAALMLSQAVWLAETRADAEGWFVWTQEDCEAQTGISFEQQKTARCKLHESGLIEWVRRGDKGALHFRVCGNLLNKIGEKPETEGAPEAEVSGKSLIQEIPDSGNPLNKIGEKPETEGAPEAEVSGKSLIQEIPDSGNPLNKIGEKPETEGGIVSLKALKTLEESLPPISPRVPQRPRNATELAKDLLRAFRCVRYPGQAEITESDWAAYRETLRTAVRDGVSTEQYAQATAAAMARWSKIGMVNPRSVLRHLTSLLEPETRGSPAKDRRDWGYEELEQELDTWFPKEGVGDGNSGVAKKVLDAAVHHARG